MNSSFLSSGSGILNPNNPNNTSQGFIGGGYQTSRDQKKPPGVDSTSGATQN